MSLNERRPTQHRSRSCEFGRIIVDLFTFGGRMRIEAFWGSSKFPTRCLGLFRLSLLGWCHRADISCQVYTGFKVMSLAPGHQHLTHGPPDQIHAALALKPWE